MTFLDAAILGIVEGLTEFLPVSSTGHLILTSHLLGLGDSEATKAFEVIIQSGAIVAVIWEYRSLMSRTMAGILRRRSESLHLLWLITLAFFPAAIVGVILSGFIKSKLFGVTPVAIALVVGGLVMICMERFWKKNITAQTTPQSGVDSFPHLSKTKALGIGLAQCFSLWPGVSRSMSTILGGRLVGLNNKQAAEFSFLLAIPTIVGASVYDLYKSRTAIVAADLNWITLAVGLFFSFITALVVIRAFLKFLMSNSLEVFGWYRIGAGLLFLLVI